MSQASIQLSQSGVSKEVIQKISMKSQVETEIRQRNSKIMSTDEHKKLIQEHIYVAEKVHHKLRSQGKTAFLRSELLELIRQD